MKKITLILSLALFACTNETPCDCYKINYDTLIFTNCVPSEKINCLGFRVRDTIFDIGCQLERGKENADGVWFEYKCVYK